MFENPEVHYHSRLEDPHAVDCPRHCPCSRSEEPLRIRALVPHPPDVAGAAHHVRFTTHKHLLGKALRSEISNRVSLHAVKPKAPQSSLTTLRATASGRHKANGGHEDKLPAPGYSRLRGPRVRLSYMAAREPCKPRLTVILAVRRSAFHFSITGAEASVPDHRQWQKTRGSRGSG